MRDLCVISIGLWNKHEPVIQIIHIWIMPDPPVTHEQAGMSLFPLFFVEFMSLFSSPFDLMQSLGSDFVARLSISLTSSSWGPLCLHLVNLRSGPASLPNNCRTLPVKIAHHLQLYGTLSPNTHQALTSHATQSESFRILIQGDIPKQGLTSSAKNPSHDDTTLCVWYFSLSFYNYSIKEIVLATEQGNKAGTPPHTRPSWITYRFERFAFWNHRKTKPFGIKIVVQTNVLQ